QGRLGWTNKLDLGVAYAPAFAGGPLEFSVDVFNVFDEQEAQNRIEYGELGGPGGPHTHAGRVVSYSAPRSARFAMGYDFRCPCRGAGPGLSLRRRVGRRCDPGAL